MKWKGVSALWLNNVEVVLTPVGVYFHALKTVVEWKKKFFNGGMDDEDNG